MSKHSPDTNPPKEVLLVYDKECPACSHYCQAVHIEEYIGQLKTVNARDKSEVMEEITSQGLDIDQGMVIKIENQLYYGAEAITMLARISKKSSLFNRINRWLFKSQARSKLFYPMLRTARNLLLKIRGKAKINNLHKKPT